VTEPSDALTKDTWVLVSVVFVVYTAFAFVIPFLPLFVMELGVQDSGDVVLWSGLLIGVSPLLAGALAPAWGRGADRFGGKRVLLGALVAYVVLLGLSAVARNVVELLLLRIGVGIFGGIGPLALAMASASAAEGKAGRALGAVQAAQNLSGGVGPIAGGALADVIGMRPTFMVAAAGCAVAVGLLGAGYREPARPAAAAPADAAPPLPQRPLFAMLAILFLTAFISRSFTPVLPLQLAGVGVADARLGFSTGVLIALYSVASAGGAAGFGRLADRFSLFGLLLGNAVLSAVLLVLMARATSYAALLVTAAGLGLTFAGVVTMAYAAGDRIVSPRQRGRLFGLLSGAALVGGAISPTIAGLMAHLHLVAIYGLDAALLAVVVGAAFFVESPRPKTRDVI
jgi:DHA1 family multidrug resistance protein-like MFS transporter